MMVMPANNSNAHKLEKDFPGRMGLLIGPGGWRSPRGLPFALDNGRFSVWSKGLTWNPNEYLAFLDQVEGYDPLWGVVPDVVGDAEKTFDWWNERRSRGMGSTLKEAMEARGLDLKTLSRKMGYKTEVTTRSILNAAEAPNEKLAQKMGRILKVAVPVARNDATFVVGESLGEWMKETGKTVHEIARYFKPSNTLEKSEAIVKKALKGEPVSASFARRLFNWSKCRVTPNPG